MRRRLYPTRGIWAYLLQQQLQQLQQMPSLLDNISSVAACYSLRKLRTAYSGAAIRVRRSSDNTELDIGFTPTGDLDIVTLLAFVMTGNGFVTIWYDQSINGINAPQTTAANQPRIVNAGVIETQNGKPTLYFAGTGQFLQTAPALMFPTAFTVIVVADVLVDSPSNSLISKMGVSNINTASPFDLNAVANPSAPIGRFFYGNGNEITSANTDPILLSSLPLSIWTMQGSSSKGANVFVNGVNAATIAPATTSSIAYEDEGASLYIGQRADGETKLNGYISEVTTFFLVLSTTENQQIKDSQTSYYSIS